MITNYHTTASRASLLLERGYNAGVRANPGALIQPALPPGAEGRADGVQYILEQGKKQYELAKQNIDLINMKYHDLKHRSEALSARRGGSLEEKAELDRALEGYSALVKTGSEVLDVISARKCSSAGRGIEMTCMADGQGLGFIRTHHLTPCWETPSTTPWEAVEGLLQEKRVISLFVRSLGNLSPTSMWRTIMRAPPPSGADRPPPPRGKKTTTGTGCPA